MSFSLPGLASGLDTATIISQLMQIEKIPYNKLEQRKTAFNNEQAVFRSINTKLTTLRSAASDLMLSSNFRLNSATNSDDSILKVSASENAAEASYTIKVQQLATHHAMKSAEFDQNGTNLDGTSIQIGDQTFTLSGENNADALEKLVQDINRTADLGVKASLIQSSDTGKTLVLTSEKSGASNQIQVAPGGVFDMTETVEARNAIVFINGIEVNSSSNELKDVMTGISLTLTKEGETTVSVSRDADKIAAKVQAFVDAYNDVVSTIRSNNGTGKSLQSDSTLRSLEAQLNQLFNSSVGGNSAFQYMHEIGLEIDKGKLKGSEMTGTISFDKDKFKSALADDPDAVYHLFAFDDSEGDGKSGVAKLFNDSMINWTRTGSGLLQLRIENYNKEIKLLTDQMENMQIRLDMKENQLKRQFTAMETALVQLQNQQAWMASQLASMYAQM